MYVCLFPCCSNISHILPAHSRDWESGLDVVWRPAAGLEAGMLKLLRTELAAVLPSAAAVAAYAGRHPLEIAVHHARLWLQLVKAGWLHAMPVDGLARVGI